MTFGTVQIEGLLGLYFVFFAAADQRYAALLHIAEFLPVKGGHFLTLFSRMEGQENRLHLILLGIGNHPFDTIIRLLVHKKLLGGKNHLLLRLLMEKLGQIESGGCNPWPIFAENKTVTADEISISYDFLAEAQGIFANWKGKY